VASSIDLSPDETTAAVSYADGRVVVWDLDPDAWAGNACALMTRTPTSAPTGSGPTIAGDEQCPTADDTDGPGGSTPTGTGTPVWPAFTDATIATSALLSAADYGPGWLDDVWVVPHFDATVAAGIPGCRSSLNVAFETTSREAAVAAKSFFYLLPGVPRASEYVVVFPDEQHARAMYDTLASDAFTTDCLSRYSDVVAPDAIRHQPDESFIPFTGAPQEPPAISKIGDDSFVRAYEASWIGDVSDVLGPGTWNVATVLVGRAVVITEAPSHTGAVTDEDFTRIVTTAAQRALSALERA
jgi:hypothetical protein